MLSTRYLKSTSECKSSVRVFALHLCVTLHPCSGTLCPITHRSHFLITWLLFGWGPNLGWAPNTVKAVKEGEIAGKWAERTEIQWIVCFLRTAFLEILCLKKRSDPTIFSLIMENCNTLSAACCFCRWRQEWNYLSVTNTYSTLYQKIMSTILLCSSNLVFFLLYSINIVFILNIFRESLSWSQKRQHTLTMTSWQPRSSKE